MFRRATRPDRRAPSRRPSLERLESRELLAQFAVTTAADGGPGSLRAAILAANASNTVGADSISFAIGTGVQTIALSSPLPEITRTLAIDGFTQPGFDSVARVPQVVIDGTGAGAGANGLILSGTGASVVRGLAIVGFTEGATGGGAGILLSNTSGSNILVSNYFGILPSGDTARPNTNGVVVTTQGNLIGGSSPGDSNLISGNANAGVVIAGVGSTGNLISNNLIGTDRTGFFSVGNGTGVILAAPNNTVGGPTTASRNLISGNVGPSGQTGIGVLFKGLATGNVVAGNLIGTDASGATAGGALANVYGVYFGTPGGDGSDNVASVTIGGTASGAGNVISGNFIGITGNVTTALIAGNTIGLSGDGTRPIPNGNGIFLGATGTTIGGTTPAARNVISASNTATGADGTGLVLSGDANLVQGNYVGLTSSGLGAAGVGNVVGIALSTTRTTIGGTAAGAGNVISGNSGDALTLDNNGGNLIQGNRIGRTPAAAVEVPNGGNGIAITLTPPSGPGPFPTLELNDTIGGTAAGAGNTITGGAGSGVVVRSTYPGAVTGLMIRGNPIFGTGRIGIDLVGDGVPVPGSLFLTAATVAGGSARLQGVYTGTPGTAYDIDLFGNAADAPVSPSGFGPGQFYLGSTRVTTDASGIASFDSTFAAPAGFTLVAYSGTVTGPDGNTSEFSANFPTSGSVSTADLAVTAASSAGTVTVGDLVTFTETITNNGPNAAADVVLSDSLPTSLVNLRVTTTAGTATVDGASNVVTARLGSLAAGQSVTVTIVGTASQQGQVVDNPGVSSTTLDPNFANNAASQVVTVNPAASNPNADLAIVATATPGTLALGANLTYTLTVTNNGPTAATNVTVNDFLPAGVALVSALPSQGSTPTVNGTLVSSNLGAIAPGASATLVVVVTPTAAGTVVNSANVSGNQPDPVNGNNAASVSTVVTPTPTPTPPPTPVVNLIIGVTPTPAAGAVGQIQVFTVTVVNAGPDPATNVTIIDALPANAVYLLANPSQGSPAVVANGVVTANLGTLAAGASATLTIVVVPTAAGTVANFAGVFTPDLPTAAPAFNAAAVAVPEPLAGPSVIGLAGTGRNSQLVLSFNLPLNAASARDPSNYTLTATGPRGRNRRIPIAAITYNPVANAVFLVPTRPLDPAQTYRLVVNGAGSSGITDLRGRRLVGTIGGASGTNYTANFRARNLPQV